MLNGSTGLEVRRGPGRPPRIPENGNGSSAVAAVPQKAKTRGRSRQDIEIQPIKTAVMEFGLVGTNDLIVNKFSHKATDMIRDKQTGEATKAREKKVPFNDFMGSLHILPGATLPAKKLKTWEAWPFKRNTFGFPAGAFKKAAIAACSFCGGTKTIAKGAFHVLGDLIPLKYRQLVMREDHVRVGPFGNRKADLRYRGAFKDWSVRLQVRYNASLLTPSQIVNLFEHAGFSVGVGEWRPSSPQNPGDFGTFSVERG
jgi:hypothetical protein